MSLIRRANISDKALDLSNFNRMVDYVNMLAGMTVDQNMTISKGPPVFMLGIKPTGAASGLDMTDIDFGYNITDATARTTDINPGVFRHSQQHFTVLGAAGLVVSTSPAYVYVEYIRGSTPTIKPVTYDLNETIPDTTAYRHLLYTFTISSSGGLEDPTIHHLGGIFIGAYWA